MAGPFLSLLGVVLSASLLGSLHCVGMCGPLLALARGPGTAGPSARLLWTYHAGRLVAYVGLGSAAGLLGRALDLSGAIFGFQQMALGLTGLMLIGFGALQFVQAFGHFSGAAGLPGGLLPGALKRRAQSLFARFAPRVSGLPRWMRPLGLGLLSALLPCGWLYAFVALAAGLGGPLPGALLMAAFWLGGLPALGLFSLFLSRALGPGRRLVPRLSALLLLVMGCLALLGRGRLAPLVLAQGGDLPAALERLDQEPECCREPGQ